MWQGDRPSRRRPLLLQTQLLPQGSSSSSQDQGCVAHRNKASAVSMAAADPVFIHSGEQLQDVSFLEAQVPSGSTCVVTQRPNFPTQQMPSGHDINASPETPQMAKKGSHQTGRGFDAHLWRQ